MARKKLMRELATDLSDEQRLGILREHTLFAPEKPEDEWRSVDDTKWCLHCDRQFSGRSARIFRNPDFADGFEVECGTEGCDGSPMDFAAKPWWRGNVAEESTDCSESTGLTLSFEVTIRDGEHDKVLELFRFADKPESAIGSALQKAAVGAMRSALEKHVPAIEDLEYKSSCHVEMDAGFVGLGSDFAVEVEVNVLHRPQEAEAIRNAIMGGPGDGTTDVEKVVTDALWEAWNRLGKEGHFQPESLEGVAIEFIDYGGTSKMLKDRESLKELVRPHLQHNTLPQPTRTQEPKVGRNELCPCSSGKKYKKCCGR